MAVTRTRDGFILSGAHVTIFARFTTYDGEPAVAFHELGESAETFVTTWHPRGVAYFAYHELRHEARWKPEIEWDV